MNGRACASVGIDLGTTYSSLAYMDAQMTPRMVADSSGQTVVPSVIFFEDQEVIVGEIALQHAKLRPDRVFQFIKVHMGDTWSRTVDGRVHTPESLSAIILAHLLREAEPQVGPIPSAVITVPAFFTEKRRRATENAGQIAGLQVIGTLNEPMAAALAYGLYREEKEQIAMVYDLGGGTFDVTIVRITPDDLEELVTCGNRQLGGKDWDQCLADHVIEQFQKATKVDPRDSAQAMQSLNLQCEQAKRRLSRLAKTPITLSAFGRDHTVEITREKFEDLAAHLLGMTKLTAEMALEDANLRWDQLSRVVLVGGSTHMPMVRNMLKQTAGFAPDTGVNPVLAVALGAASYAHMLETGRSPKRIHNKELEQKQVTSREPAMPRVRFVTAHGLGVKTLDRSGNWLNVVLIPKNHVLPVTRTQRFGTKTTQARGRRLKIQITQGDTPNIDLAEILGALRIDGIPAGDADGQPVDVTLTFDEHGRLSVHAVYVNTGQSLALSLEIPGCLREEQIEQYRKYMEDTGLIRSYVPPEVLEPIVLLDDDEDDFDIIAI